MSDLVDWTIDLLLTSPVAYKQQQEINTIDGQEMDSKSTLLLLLFLLLLEIFDIFLVGNNPSSLPKNDQEKTTAKAEINNDADQASMGSKKPKRNSISTD